MHCVACNAEMHLVKQKAIVWELGKSYSRIRKHHDNNGMRHNLPDYLSQTLANHNDTWSITRSGETGLSLDRFSGDPVHTWFMGLSGYRAAVKEYLNQYPERGDFSSWWSPDTHLVHFLRLDCSYSHAVAYSAQLICDPSGPSIGHFFTNLFLKLNNDDFSTSRGNAIWIKDIAGQFPIDAVRFFTALHAPETEQMNFSMHEFESWFKNEYKPLVKILENIDLSKRNYTKQDCENYWDSTNAIKKYKRAIAINLDTFSMSQMAQSLNDLVNEIKLAPDEMKSEGCYMFAQLCKPIMPSLSQKLLERT